MKRIHILLFVLLLLPVGMCAQGTIFRKYATRADVKYVSISHTMLQAMSSKKTVRLGNMQLSDMLDYIDNVLIISSADPTGMTVMLSDLNTLQSDTQYTSLLEKNMNGQRNISFFFEQTGTNEFILFSLAEAYTIVVITGHFSPEQFQSFFL